jgi:hypothetical protein
LNRAGRTIVVALGVGNEVDTRCARVDPPLDEFPVRQLPILAPLHLDRVHSTMKRHNVRQPSRRKHASNVEEFRDADIEEMCYVWSEIVDDLPKDTCVVFPEATPPGAWKGKELHTGIASDLHVSRRYCLADPDDRNLVAMRSLRTRKRPERVEVTGRTPEPERADVKNPHYASIS